MADTNYIKAIYATLARCGLKSQKEALVLGVTDGRTGSVSDMYDREAIALLRSLNGQQDSYVPGTKLKMKRKVLALAHEMGWEKDGGKVDMKRVDGYCQTRGHARKPFNDYTVKELPKLIQQFQRMVNNYRKA